jgi:TonB family protein
MRILFSMSSMANQALLPPDLDQREPLEPKLLSEIIDEPAWKTMAGNLYDLLYPRKLPPLVLTSKPIAVIDPMKENRGRASSIIAISLHVLIVGLILWLSIAAVKKAVSKNQLLTNVEVPQYMPIAPKGPQMGGGGGGGSHDILQAPKGRLPKFEDQPIVPPMVIKNDHPKLVADPAIMMPKDIQLPNNNLPNLGDPRTSIVGPASNGTGSGAGMGSGSGGGIGSGHGNGYGPGEGGGYGGGLYHVGGGVSAPQLVFAPDPEFSDEARRAKYQGVCVVSLIVDAQGNPQRVQVVRHLGMGLDEKAVEAVKQYRFKPATLQGKPVPVEVNIEVNFRIY